MIDIAGLQGQIGAIADRITAFLLLQKLGNGVDQLPEAGSLAVTVSGTDANGNPFNRTLQDQIAALIVTVGAGIVSDAAALSDFMRTQALPELGLDPGANPNALLPSTTIADMFTSDPNKVNTWLNGMLQFVSRVNEVFG